MASYPGVRWLRDVSRRRRTRSRRSNGVSLDTEMEGADGMNSSISLPKSDGAQRRGTSRASMCEMGLGNGRTKGPRGPEVEPDNRRAFQGPEVLKGRN
jgi:hypothetical protein